MCGEGRQVLRTKASFDAAFRGAGALRWTAKFGPVRFNRSVLRPDEIKPELTTEQRRDLAYEASLPLIEDALSRRSKLSEQELREFAARGFIAAGGISRKSGRGYRRRRQRVS